ncbi:MAG: hypothetical protein Harvfovirus42_4 [Harvfovirus sp.]|uniref:Uncharacterized protein n=1 Tax=Harvfovirus sp. TaxID=2487768 RepID=A0A3G5A4Z5_9VIRU|nr:MAG: hypothetical protein Harvfovirus42_4 [Harvfovirus sp.]
MILDLATKIVDNNINTNFVNNLNIKSTFPLGLSDYNRHTKT